MRPLNFPGLAPRCAIALAVFLSRATAEVPPVIKELIAQMRTELQAEVKAARDDVRSVDRHWQLSSMLLQIERSFEDEDEASSGYYDLSQLAAAIQGFPSPKIEQIAQALAREASREVAEREKRVVAEIEKLIEAQAIPALNARTAAEIDAPLAALNKAQSRQSVRRESRKMQSATEQLRNAITFLTQWQDYLAAKEAGNTEQTRSALNNLTASGREYPFVPRSKLLALLHSAQNPSPGPQAGSITALIAGIKSIDDLAGAARQIGHSVKIRTSQESEAASDLRELADTYAKVKDGQAAFFRVPNSGLSSDLLTPVREMVFAFVLPRMLQFEDGLHPVRPGENPSGYLRRMLQEGQQQQDWVLVGRVLATSRSLNLLGSVSPTADSAALSQFLAALNFQKAKQYALAVEAFQAALKTGSEVVPAELIGQHLEKIRAEHSREFDEGVQLAVRNPATNDPRSFQRAAPLPTPSVDLSKYPPRQTLGPDGQPLPIKSMLDVVVPPKATPSPLSTPAPAK
ncbi:MAG: hypothetical protein ABMA13_11890 [Chthoniobacteraceae bacterium]